MLALGTLKNWYFASVDVQSAYLYGTLKETIYMKQPPGLIVKGKEHWVYKCIKLFMGLSKEDWPGGSL